MHNIVERLTDIMIYMPFHCLWRKPSPGPMLTTFHRNIYIWMNLWVMNPLCSFDGRLSVLSLVALVLWPNKLRSNVADSQEVWVPTPHQGCGAEDTTRLPRVVSSSCADWHPFKRVHSNKRQLRKYTHTLSSFYLQMPQHLNVLGHHHPQSCVSP